MNKLEIWLYKTFPFVFSDIISWVLHGVVTAVGGFVGVLIGGPAQVFGAGVSCFMAGWYWNREDHDLEKARQMSDGYKQRQKIADSGRDRWTPFVVAFFFLLLLATSL
ncbi:MAG: hypothetical protein AMJ65_15530 [Phycisphaerae bacterium SG8_4]|nr:MAG: hypothetical protein AMJ65_15530 [Phycisphaerae bacterium SG8_4]